MRFTASLFALIFSVAVLAQDGHAPAPSLDMKVVTVPFALDHDRVVIEADLPLPDGSTTRVRAWVDNGDPELRLSRRVATLTGLSITCGDRACSAVPPHEITIGGMKIPLVPAKEANIPLKPAAAAAVMEPGMNAEISIPSTVLRDYDVLIDLPGHQLTIGQPGSLKFRGVKAKVSVNAQNGLVQVPSQIENKKYNLALDLGSSISFLGDELFNKLAATHSDWPHMTGAIGPANMWGESDEPNWKLMRVDRLQFGPIYLTNVAAADFPKNLTGFFEKRAGNPAAGLLGASSLRNYRIGIDYAHSMVYFDIGRTFKFPDFDVIGLILRPEADGRFTIIGIADYDGKPSVPGVEAGDHLVAVDGIPVLGSTMGQVWLMLGGEPGKARTLAIERDDKEFAVVAKVQHFLGEAEDKEQAKGKSNKN